MAVQVLIPPHGAGEEELVVSNLESNQTASLAVRSFDPSVLVSCSPLCAVSAQLESQLELQVQGFPQAAAAGVQLRGNRTAFLLLSSSFQRSLLILRFLVSPGPPLLVPSWDSQLTIVPRADPSKLATLTVSYFNAPRVLLATFDEQGGSVSIVFDQPTSAQLGDLPCSLLLRVQRMGEAPRCSFPDSSSLLLVLGPNAQLLPGDQVVVLGGQLRSINGVSSLNEEQNVTVLAPRSPAPPQLSLLGPNFIGECDEAILAASAPSPRPLDFSWSCSNNLTVSAMLAGRRESSVSVSASLLLPEVTYVIQVIARSFLGGTSELVAHEVTRKSVPPPLIDIDMPPPPYLPSSQLVLKATAKFSSCATSKTPLSFDWTVTDAGSGELVVQRKGPLLFLAPGTLRAGKIFQVLLSSRSSSSSLSVVKSLTMQASSLRAIISGGNKTVSRSSLLLLDGSRSLDPDCNGDATCTQSEIYEWSCWLEDGSTCRYSSGAPVVSSSTAKTFSLGDAGGEGEKRVEQEKGGRCGQNKKRRENEEEVKEVQEEEVVVEEEELEALQEEQEG
eukprot:765096-Hanusia_phi.AAC.3